MKEGPFWGCACESKPQGQSESLSWGSSSEAQEVACTVLQSQPKLTVSGFRLPHLAIRNQPILKSLSRRTQ